MSMHMFNKLAPFIVRQNVKQMEYETLADSVIASAYAGYFNSLPECSAKGGVLEKERQIYFGQALPLLIKFKR